MHADQVGLRGRLGGDPALRAMAGLCAAVLVFAALREASSVFVPATFALFIIAVFWPVQRLLESRLPKLLALLVTIVIVLVSVVGLAMLVAWGFSRVGQWTIVNASRFQDIYLRQTEWLEGHGIPVAGLFAEHFDMRWVVWLAQSLTGRMQGLLSFLTVTLVFTMLGMLEVEVIRRKLVRMGRNGEGTRLLRACEQIGSKLQTYMLVRTVMSAVTGLSIWAFALAVGLELPVEWGMIAFALNYIPFLGPLTATVFPTLFAGLQFGSWEAALTVFLCLNVIQFVSGSYIEPRLAGKAVSVSPFLVLFAVFFWSFLWGIAGAFIGIPVTIALLVVCAQYDSTRWVAALLSGRDDAAA
ncbi:AI-2E family transporter [Roseomonas sp. NAR14]|uniref:AI-2E family transporter n=1 Tax=Roseomonas acroporae TaxID=2937791 RepID=A0A9X1YAP9_9PROT|nr:AI-2E family transporter [Roseomonas acroporae]MCK8786235.1 AI-2E family transporter [Roseomonas acroporae]